MNLDPWYWKEWFEENDNRLRQWFEDNLEDMKPPIGNKIIYPDDQLIYMGVLGPNTRKDFHYHERGPEFFYQLRGDISLKIFDEEKGPQDDVIIREGEFYAMPQGTIHSPQRPDGTWGAVVEPKALHGELDHFRWYCENTGCNNKLHEVKGPLKDIVKDLPPIMKAFEKSLDLRTCNECGYVMEPPR